MKGLTKWVYGDDIFRYVSDQYYCQEDLDLADFTGIYDQVLVYLYINDSETAFARYSKKNIANHDSLILDMEKDLKWGIAIPFEKYEGLLVTGDIIYYQIATLTSRAYPFTKDVPSTQDFKRSHAREPLAIVTTKAQDILIELEKLTP